MSIIFLQPIITHHAGSSKSKRQILLLLHVLPPQVQLPLRYTRLQLHLLLHLLTYSSEFSVSSRRCFHSNIVCFILPSESSSFVAPSHWKTLMYPDSLPHIYSCMSSGSSQFPPLSLYSARMGAFDAMKTA